MLLFLHEIVQNIEVNFLKMTNLKIANLCNFENENYVFVTVSKTLIFGHPSSSLNKL